jgi:hypothetical protein
MKRYERQVTGVYGGRGDTGLFEEGSPLYLLRVAERTQKNYFRCSVDFLRALSKFH